MKLELLMCVKKAPLQFHMVLQAYNDSLGVSQTSLGR